MAKTKEILRVIRFHPYRKGMGPVFRLKVWDTNERDSCGKWVLGYRLSMGEPNAVGNPPVWTVIFEGEDFGCSPMHAVDSDETMTGIMCFLTLRPGDTDQEYFKDYTPEQLDYCAQHAEALAHEVDWRFGNG